MWCIYTECVYFDTSSFVYVCAHTYVYASIYNMCTHAACREFLYRKTSNFTLSYYCRYASLHPYWAIRYHGERAVRILGRQWAQSRVLRHCTGKVFETWWCKYFSQTLSSYFILLCFLLEVRVLSGIFTAIYLFLLLITCTHPYGPPQYSHFIIQYNPSNPFSLRLLSTYDHYRNATIVQTASIYWRKLLYINNSSQYPLNRPLHYAPL